MSTMGSEPHPVLVEAGAGDTGRARSDGYAELLREVRRAGLMDRRRGRYLVRIAVTLLTFALAAVAFVAIGDSWWQLVTAPVFAVLFVQFGFIGHDAGHGQIFASRRANDLVGYLHGDLLIGLGYGWWVGKHNAHHANPNHEDRDPDVDMGILAFTEAQSDGPTAPARGPVGRFVIRHQAGLFFPLLLLEGLDLHVSAVRSLLGRRVPHRRLEIVLLAAHAALYATAVFVVLSPLPAVVFIVVQQGLFGLYLGCAFAPGHKGMPMPTAADQLDPVRRQVLTSRNIVGGRVVDLLLGGLNHQVEHHLFPRMPRTSLRRARPLVRAFCARHAIPYTETTLLDSYARGLRHLRAVSAPARALADR
jgi:fatty acid desaturase